MDDVRTQYSASVSPAAAVFIKSMMAAMAPEEEKG